MDRVTSIEVAGLDFAWGDLEALSGVSFSLEAGETAAIIGPNGAGKSTLLRLLSGFLKPDAGTIRIEPFGEISGMNRREAARTVALVPQYSSIYSPYTVEKLVQLGRYPYVGMFGGFGEKDEEAVEAALAATGMAPLRGRTVTTLSGGEFQRAIIAKALAQEPEILLMDEPTAHLDISAQMGILEIVREYSEKRSVTVVSVLHDINLAAAFFNRVLILRAGKIIADGGVNETLTEDTIEKAYNWPVRTLDLTGRKIIVPKRAKGEI
ncbi:MAG: ABC transporter ATP-binding protein [bacterium]|nr:ABC transporter ATP-binding protein [bacterium]